MINASSISNFFSLMTKKIQVLTEKVPHGFFSGVVTLVLYNKIIHVIIRLVFFTMISTCFVDKFYLMSLIEEHPLGLMYCSGWWEGGVIRICVPSGNPLILLKSFIMSSVLCLLGHCYYSSN